MNQITDARGTPMSCFKKATRIVSLVPSQTELLFHLGLNEEVVGITKFCVHPPHWFRSKPRVGGTKQIDLKNVQALQPDLVLANKEENEKAQVEALAREFPVWVTDVATLTDALHMIETVGLLTGKEENATFSKAHIEQAFEALHHSLPQKKIRACYLIWNEPLMTVGGDTFINDMMQRAGFENLFVSLKRYPQITIETLQKSDCDVLLLSSEPFPFSQKHINLLQPQLPHTKILLVDGEAFSWYGSRLLQAPAYFKQLRAMV